MSSLFATVCNVWACIDSRASANVSYLWMAFLWITSEVPPRQLSRRKRAASSDDMRVSFFCTPSNTRMVDVFVSRTMSNWKHESNIHDTIP